MIKMKKEERDYLIREIQDFFLNERDEELGIIASEVVLDFFLETLGDKIYNIALNDAKIFFKNKVENMDLDYDMLYKG